MRVLISAFFLLLGYTSFSQQKAPPPSALFYFYGKDSLVGVKTAKGDVVIPPRYLSPEAAEEGTEIKGPIIYLYRPNDSSRRGYSLFSNAFDRRGRFLFHPYWYDSGNDLLVEGRFRFVEGSKMGFSDRYGKKVVPARYDYVTPFEHGLAFFCNGCSFYVDTSAEDKEHNLKLSAGTWGAINTKGEVVLPPSAARRANPPTLSDSLIARAKPLTATAAEKVLLRNVAAIPTLPEKLVESWYSKPERVTYQIVERPSASFPYYWIKAYGHFPDVVLAIDDFAVHQRSKKVFHYWPSFEEFEPVEAWLNGGGQ